METSFRKTVAYILVAVVIVLMAVGILNVWGFINLDDVWPRLMKSLFVVFIGAVVILFITAVLIKDDNRDRTRNL